MMKSEDNEAKDIHFGDIRSGQVSISPTGDGRYIGSRIRVDKFIGRDRIAWQDDLAKAKTRDNAKVMSAIETEINQDQE